MIAKPNVFAAGALDRASHLRTDAAWLQQQFAASDTLFVPMWQSKNYFRNGQTTEPLLVQQYELNGYAPESSDAIFLGLQNGKPLFALDLSHIPEPLSFLKDRGTVFVDELKSWGMVLAHQQAALLAYVRGIVLWQKRYRFCGTCGHRTQGQAGGHHRVCSNPDCGAQYFSRTDPAVIVQVTRGDRILLGRQPNWKKGVYSTLAGFVEPGESLEDAVRREVHEESGILVEQIRYHSSQPWPFPSSLMLGFTAIAQNSEIHLTDDELDDARWFTRDEIHWLVSKGDMHLPSEVSIARRLVEEWLAGK